MIVYRVKPSWAEQVEQGDDAGMFNCYLQLSEQAQTFSIIVAMSPMSPSGPGAPKSQHFFPVN